MNIANRIKDFMRHLGSYWDQYAAHLRVFNLLALPLLLHPQDMNGQPLGHAPVSEEFSEFVKRSKTFRQSVLGYPYDRRWNEYRLPRNPNETLGTWSQNYIAGKINQLARVFSERSEYAQLKAFVSRSASDLDWRIHHGGLSEVPQGEGPKYGEFGKFLGHSSERIALQDLKNRYPIDRYSAIRWEFGLTGPKNESPVPRFTRYGLILKEIRPDGQGQSYAALSDWESAVEHAPKAKILWKVGPVSDDSLAHYPFQSDKLLPEAGQSTAEKLAHFGLPDPRMKLTVKAENFDNFSFVGREKSFALWRIDTEQVDGLYQFSTFHRPDLKQTHAEHRWSLPLASRKFWLGRVYDEQIVLKESHLRSQIQLWERAEVAARYNHLEQRWVVDLGDSFGGIRWGLVAKGKAGSSKVTPKEAAEKYAMNYNIDF